MAEVMAPPWVVLGDCADCGAPAHHPASDDLRAYLTDQGWPMPCCTDCLVARMKAP